MTRPWPLNSLVSADRRYNLLSLAHEAAPSISFLISLVHFAMTLQELARLCRF